MNYAAPSFSAETAPFWKAAAAGELRLPYCAGCDSWNWPGTPTCMACRTPPDWRRVSGRGTIYAMSVIRRAPHPSVEAAVPYVVALVELAEGVRLLTNVTGCDPGALRPGLAVQVEFLAASDSEFRMPVFSPADGPRI